MSLIIIDIFICSFCCVGLYVLIAGLFELPEYLLNNPTMIINIINFNNTIIPNEFSFTTENTNLCNILDNNNNVKCTNIINCPSNIEIGKIYNFYCSCLNLICSFDNIHIKTFYYSSILCGGIIISIVLLYILCRLIYIKLKKNQK